MLGSAARFPRVTGYYKFLTTPPQDFTPQAFGKFSNS
jgi:hypothetical protein